MMLCFNRSCVNSGSNMWREEGMNSHLSYIREKTSIGCSELEFASSHAEDTCKFSLPVSRMWLFLERDRSCNQVKDL